VAMNDPFGVSRLHRIRQLNTDIEYFSGAKRPAVDALFERLAVEIFHHDKRPSFVLADIVNGADLRMIQGRSSSRLDSKSLERLRIFSIPLRQNLHRHWPAQPDILALVDHAHAASAEMLENPVVRNRLTDHPGNPNKSGLDSGCLPPS